MIGFGKTAWIGVDVGTCTVKLAQVERAGDHVRLATSVIVPRQHVAEVTKMPNDEAPWSILDEIRAGLDLCPGFRGRQAACVLSMPYQDFRTLTLPRATDQERHQMVQGELSAAGIDVENRVFDCWVGSTSEQGTDEVHTLSVPRRIVNNVAQDLSKAGLACQLVDGLPFALARATHLGKSSPQRAPVAWVDWGYSSTTFCLVVDRYPKYCRTMRNCSLSQLRASVRDGLGLSEDQLTEILMGHGLPAAGDEDGTRRAIQESIADLAGNVLHEFQDQLRKTVNYLAARTPYVPQSICIRGGAATIRNLHTFLADELNLPITAPPAVTTRGGEDEAAGAVLGNAMAVSALAWQSARIE